MTEPHDDGGALQTTVMAPKSFLTLELTAGQVMRVEDMDGIQCADIAFLDREDYRRRKGEAGGAIAQSLIEQYSPAGRAVPPCGALSSTPVAVTLRVPPPGMAWTAFTQRLSTTW